MFDHRSLLRAGRKLEVTQAPALDIVDEALRHVLRRQVAVPTQAALRYPDEETLLHPLRNELAALPAELVLLACHTLLDPQLVVPRAEPIQVDAGISRAAILLSVGTGEDGTSSGILIEVQWVVGGKGRFAPTTSFRAAVTTVSGDEIAYALEETYMRTTTPMRARAVARAPRAMWLGGDREDDTLPVDGAQQIAAVVAVRGYAAEIVQRPLRSWRTVKERLDNSPPAVALVWTPFATPAPYEEIAQGRFDVFRLDEVDFDQALMLARLLLDDLPDGATAAEPPHDWEHFEARLTDLERKSFAITENARQTVRSTGYPHPSRMWEHLEALANAAAAFAEVSAEVGGRLADWIHSEFGIEVAMHDDNLQGGQKTFYHEGTAYSREPHVKVDDAKAWIEVGRIYFAVDPEGSRFIVDHIGGKLY